MLLLGWLYAKVFKPLPAKVDNISELLLEKVEEQLKGISARAVSGLKMTLHPHLITCQAPPFLSSHYSTRVSKILSDLNRRVPDHKTAETFWVDGLWSHFSIPSSIPSSSILSFVLQPSTFFLKTKSKVPHLHVATFKKRAPLWAFAGRHSADRSNWIDRSKPKRSQSDRSDREATPQLAICGCLSSDHVGWTSEAASTIVWSSIAYSVMGWTL